MHAGIYYSKVLYYEYEDLLLMLKCSLGMYLERGNYMFEFNRIFKKNKYIEVKNLENDDGDKKPNIPSGMWVKCKTCGEILYNKDLEKV